MLQVTFHDESLFLLPQRAIFWPRRRTLIVSDVHFGKAATFRAAGIPAPEVIAADLAAIDALIAAHAPARLIITGDLFHAAPGRTAAVLEPLRLWRLRHAALDVLIIRGNHDLRAGDPPPDLRFRIVPEPFADPDNAPLAFAHDPAAAAESPSPVICGHLHPAITITDTCTALRAPCFWATPRALVLPAFGRFTGARGIAPAAGDRVFVIGGGEVHEIRSAGTQAPSHARTRTRRARASARPR